MLTKQAWSCWTRGAVRPSPARSRDTCLAGCRVRSNDDSHLYCFKIIQCFTCKSEIELKKLKIKWKIIKPYEFLNRFLFSALTWFFQCKRYWTTLHGWSCAIVDHLLQSWETYFYVSVVALDIWRIQQEIIGLYPLNFKNFRLPDLFFYKTVASFASLGTTILAQWAHHPLLPQSKRLQPSSTSRSSKWTPLRGCRKLIICVSADSWELWSLMNFVYLKGYVDMYLPFTYLIYRFPAPIPVVSPLGTFIWWAATPDTDFECHLLLLTYLFFFCRNNNIGADGATEIGNALKTCSSLSVFNLA